MEGESERDRARGRERDGVCSFPIISVKPQL